MIIRIISKIIELLRLKLLIYQSGGVIISALFILFSKKRKKIQSGLACFNKFLSKEEFIFLENLLDALEPHLHWKILLLQTICRKENLFLAKFKGKQREENFKIIKEYYTNIVEVELQNTVSAKQELNLNVRRKLLENRLVIMKNAQDNNFDFILKESILYGRFDKSIFKNLSHTIIIGEDGGFYALLNTINEDDIKSRTN